MRVTYDGINVGYRDFWQVGKSFQRISYVEDDSLSGINCKTYLTEKM